MDLSFEEKSLWLLVLSLIGVSGFYMFVVLPTHAANVMPQHIVLFTLSVVFLVIAQVVGHVLIVLVDRRTDTDERSRLIGLKGTRNGAYVLATGVFAALCAALLTDGNFVFTHVLLGFWVVAQLVESGSQLVLFRRGA